jgi:peptide/nickel transport system permease protein
LLPYLGKRILHSALSLFGLILAIFFLARLTGDPSALYLPLEAGDEARKAFAERHGFDDPIIVQFGRFVREVVHFDFGESLRHSRPALEVVLQAFPTTLRLAAFTMVIAIAIAVVTGSLAASKPGGIFDRVATTLSLIGASAPNFWTAIVGILVFAVWLRILPTSGMGGPSYWVLPVAILVLRPAGIITQVVRGSMISALSSGYVKTARAKGVPRARVIFVHGLRNALLPAITVAGDQAAGIINGAVVVETVFGFSGIGSLLMDSLTYRDFTVLQAGVMFTATVVFAMNIVIDIAYAVLDPRIRYA